MTAPSSSTDLPITTPPSAQGQKRSRPGAIALDRGPAGALSTGFRSFTATILRALGFGVIAGAAVLWAIVSPPVAFTAIAQAAATAGLDLVGRALTIIAPIILPFPLAGALAFAVLCAVATWPADCRADENRHAR